MKFRASLISAAVILLTAATASGQPASQSPPIIQPGAPGQSSKILTRETATAPPRATVAADVSFMQGMIMHHSQAVEMTDLLRTRGRAKDLQELGKRISISQTDEIKYMKQWLEDHGVKTHAPWTRHQVEGLMYFKDPSGNLIEVYCPKFAGAKSLQTAGTPVDVVNLADLDYEWDPSLADPVLS